MSNDAERLQCLLLNFTDTMKNLFVNDIKEYLNIVEKIENWNNFKTIEDYINLNNDFINKALIELYQNEKCVKILKEDTAIDISVIERILIK